MANTGLSDADIGLSDEDIGLSAPPQSAGAQTGLSDSDIGLSDEDIGLETKPKPPAEGMPATAARGFFSRGLLPSIGAGIVGGGAAIVAAPSGLSIPAGLAGAVAGGYAGEKINDFLKEHLGWNDDEQWKADVEANPNTAWLSELAPALATMSPVRGLALGARGLGAAIMGGLEGVQDYYGSGHVDLKKAGMAAAAGAAFPQANRVGEALSELGAKAFRKAGSFIPGRPNMAPNPDAAQAKADVRDPTAVQNGPADATPEPKPQATGETVGMGIGERDHGNDGRFGKGPAAGSNANLSVGDIDPSVQDALRQSLNANALGAGAEPAALPPQPKPPPPEQVPVPTGIGPSVGEVMNRLKKPIGPQQRVEATEPVKGFDDAMRPRDRALDEEAGEEAKPLKAQDVANNAVTQPMQEGGEGEEHKGPTGDHIHIQHMEPNAHSQAVETILDKLDAAVKAKDRNAVIAAVQEVEDALRKTPEKVKAEDPDYWKQFRGVINRMTQPMVEAAPKKKIPWETAEEEEDGFRAQRTQPVLQTVEGDKEKGGEAPLSKSPAESVVGVETKASQKSEGPSPTTANVADKLRGDNETPERKIKGETNPNPSQKQADAGNYAKAHERVLGHDVAWETREGGIRTKYNEDGSLKWQSPMLAADYGHVLRTKGADGEPIDIFRGHGDKNFIIDQKDAATGKFDEHKVMHRFHDAQDALDTYLKSYSDDARPRFHDITEVSDEDLKSWLAGRNGSTKKPFGAPMPREKPEPKAVTVAVKLLKDAGRDADAAHLQMLPPEKRALEAAKIAQTFANKTGKASQTTQVRLRTAAPEVPGGKGVTANTADEAIAKGNALKAYNDLLERHPVGENETDAQTIARAQQILASAKAVGSRYPELMANKQEGARLVKAARALGKQPDQDKLKEFRASEQLIRAGNPELANDPDAGIANSRRAGDAMLAKGENDHARSYLADPATNPEVEHNEATISPPQEGDFAPVQVNDIANARLNKNLKSEQQRQSEFEARANGPTKPVTPGEGVEHISASEVKRGPGVPEPVTAKEQKEVLGRLQGKGKELDLTKQADRDALHVDTDKITKNIIRQMDTAEAKIKTSDTAENIAEKSAGEVKPKDKFAAAQEGAQLVQRGRVPAKPKVEKDEGRSLKSGTLQISNDELQRYLDAANAKKPKQAPTKEQELADDEWLKANDLNQKGVTPKDNNAAERGWRAALDKVEDFTNNDDGSLNHQKIAADFTAKYQAFRKGMEKYFSIPASDVGRKAYALMAKSMAHEQTLTAEAADQLKRRWYTWLKGSTEAEQFKYLTTLEKTDPQATRAQLQTALVKAGIPAEKAGWMAVEGMFHRDLMDKIWLEDAKHGSESDYIAGYVPHIFKDAAKAQAFIEQRIKTLGPQWYQKERSFDLIEDAVKHGGLQLKYNNPIDLIYGRWQASIRANMIVDAARDLEAHGLAFKVNKDTPEFARQWTPRNLPDHKQWVISPDAENFWVNAFESKGLDKFEGPIGNVVRAWMQVKQMMVPIQLALSAFHAVHEIANINPAVNITRALQLARNDMTQGKYGAVAGEFGRAAKWSLTEPLLSLPLDHTPLVGKQIGSPFKNFPGRQLMDIAQTPDAQLNPDQLMWKQMMREGGYSAYQPFEDIIGAKKDFAQALHDFTPALNDKWSYFPVAWTGLKRGIEKIQEPLFKYTIPALKNVAWMRNVAAALKMDPTLATNAMKRTVVLNQISRNIDDRFGEMFYKGLLMNKMAKDIGVYSMVSLSWNLGQLRQVAGGINNIATGATKALGGRVGYVKDQLYRADDKAQFVGTYIGLSMASAGALSYALSGEFPTGMDYFFPRTGVYNQEDHTPHRIAPPFNTKEYFMYMAHKQQHNSWLGGAMEFLWNKTIFAPLVELAQNRDFYGDKLYDINAPGYKKVFQAADAMAGRMFSPITVSGAQRARDQGEGTRGAALAYSGFGPAPKYIGNDEMENRITYLHSMEATHYSHPYEYGEKTGLGRGAVQDAVRSHYGDKLQSEARRQGKAALDRAQTPEERVEARRELMMEGGLKKRTVQKMRADQEFQYKFATLPYATQAALVKDMDDRQFAKYVTLNIQGGMSRAAKAKLRQVKEATTNP